MKKLNTNKSIVKYSVVAHLNRFLSFVFPVLLFLFAPVMHAETQQADSDDRSGIDYSITSNDSTKFEIATASYDDLPTISAVLNKYNKRHADKVSAQWVQLSPVGMRIRDDDGQSEVIKNFDQQRVWLVDRKNNINLEIDVEFYRKHLPKQVQNLIGSAGVSNILGTTPCADLQGLKNGKRSWRGQIVEEWLCSSNEHIPVNTQLYSQRWNLIVRVEHTDLNVEELVNIKQEAISIGLFEPKDTIQKVGIKEFMSGRKQLGSYSP